jgi:hypothetical protein
MKFLKLYEKFILEKYNQLSKFYHVTDKEHLESLLNGIDITLSSSRTQGNGFYVVTDEKSAENTLISMGFGIPAMKKCDLLIEIESILNTDNFDIDYELVKELPILVKSLENKLESRFKILKVTNDGHEFNVIVKLSDDVSQNDFTTTFEELEGMGVIIPKCNKDIEFGFYPVNSENFQDATNVAYTTYYMNSLDKLGLKSIIEEELFKKIGNDGKVYALRYVGPKIKPKRYKFKENGKWLDWVEL